MTILRAFDEENQRPRNEALDDSFRRIAEGSRDALEVLYHETSTAISQITG